MRAKAACILLPSVDVERLALGVVEAVVGGERGQHVHAEEEDDDVDAHGHQAHPDGGGEPPHAVHRHAEPVPGRVVRLDLK